MKESKLAALPAGCSNEEIRSVLIEMDAEVEAYEKETGHVITRGPFIEEPESD